MKKAIFTILIAILLSPFVDAQNPWNQKANYTGNARCVAIGIAINSKGYIGLGQNASGTKLYDFYEYDPASNSWTKKANYSGGGSYAATAFTANGKGYVCLGANSSGTAQSDLWEYDPGSDSWTKKTSFPGSARY